MADTKHAPHGGYSPDMDGPTHEATYHGFVRFAEIGTVTPKPQGGNPRPRLFRLERDEAVINRMGFNNDGAEATLRRLAARAHHGGIVGVNVGANKDSPDRIADYVKLIETFAPVASYFTVNVSSPNTPGLRNLQQSAALDELLAKVIDARERVRKNAGDSPVLLKIAPDLSLTELDDVVHIARSRGIDGMIVGNTTLARPSTLREQARAKEQGGLSGRPLFRLSTRMGAETYVRTEGAFPLIGVGGIDSGGAALTGNILGRNPDVIDAAVLVSCPCNVPAWRLYMHELRHRPGSPRPIETLSPLEVLPEAAARVPIRLFVGSNDDITPPWLSKAYEAAGKTLGKDVDVRILPGVGHDGALDDDAVFDQVAKLIAN